MRIVERPRGVVLPRVVGNSALRGVPGGLLYLDADLQNVGILVANNVVGCFIAQNEMSCSDGDGVVP